jgi:luciferase-like monooxygenase
MNYLAEFENEISQWPHITIQPHRFGGREFLFGKAEVGHLHVGGVVDIPFTRQIHDALLEERLAENHHWVPNSSWITFRVRSEHDMKHALWLMRLSYLRYLLKNESNPRQTFELESQHLRLSPRFRSLLELFVPKQANQVSPEAVPA